MLRDGLAWLSDRLAEHASEPVAYTRGVDSVSVPAVLGSKLLRIGDEFGGSRVLWTDMDFLVRASDLALSGVPIEPERGDLIRWASESEIQVFEVLPFGTEPPWRWSDPHQSIRRIHAKHVGAEPLPPPEEVLP